MRQIKLNNILATLLTMAALIAGQNAWAQQIQDVTLTVDPEIPEGTAGHWYVNMGRNSYDDKALTLNEYDITTGGKNIFKVYDDGGKNRNYSSGCQSTLYITVPVGYLIQVSGTVWTKNNPTFEYLGLYNANNTTFNRLAKVYSDADGEAKNFGPLVTQRVTSNHSQECTDGQYLTVFFRASSNETTYRGFDMTVTVFENTLYNVNNAEGIQHGSVSASPTQAYYNDEVTLNVTPETNYYIGTVSYNDGTTDHVITPQNNVYKFTMPQHDVTVSATFLDIVGHLWGEGNDGSAEHPYVISSQEGWNLLITKTTGTAGLDFTNGKYFELATDISGVTHSVPSFGGHLDGKGHKITLAMESDGVGLIDHIRYASSISNLTVEGSIVNPASTVGGFVAQTAGSSYVTFTNCRSSVAITSNYTGNNPFYGGGFIGSSNINGNVFDRCVFDGSFSSSNNLSFFPWIGNNGSYTVTNSAYFHNGVTRFHNGSTEAQAYLLTLTEPASAVRTSGTAIGNGAGRAYADGFTLDSNEYYTNGATVTFGVPGIIATAAQYNNGTDHNASINPDGTASFPMPATNTTATIITTNLEANYIDADGILQTHAVNLLSSSDVADTKPEGWYAVVGDVTFSKSLTFSGEAHLILTDGATLNVNDNGTGDTRIAIAATNLSVYGQTLGTGTLNADSQNSMGINHPFSEEYTYAYGIQVSGSITFCGGYVNAIATGTQDPGTEIPVKCYSIYTDGSITIIRGHVSAIATKTSNQVDANLYNISASNGILLDWRLPTDRITVTQTGAYWSSPTSPMSVAEGKSLWNGTEVLSGYISTTDQFNDKTLQPCIAREVSGYGTGNDKWAFISSPVTGSIDPTTVGGLVASTATEYDLYRFNQSANKQWENYKAHTEGFVLENGKGYLCARKDTQTLAFMGDAFNMGTSVEVPLVYDGNAEFAGWNLVGNPFTENATLDRSYYVMNTEGTGIVATAVNGATPIAPCTGVLVQTTAAEVLANLNKVTFSKVAKRGETSTGKGSLNITLTQANTRGNALLDNAIVSFNEGSQLGKFYFGEQNGNIYIPQGGKEYAIVSVSAGTDVARYVSTEVPINFKAKENGKYTITVNPEGVTFGYLHLIDNLTGADVDLLASPEYTFTAKTSDYASRFKLVFSANENQNQNQNEDFAFISNGEIIINGEGTLQVIDVLGHVIVCRDAMHCVSTAEMVPGVYVLQLINGEHVRNQKIVVK